MHSCLSLVAQKRLYRQRCKICWSADGFDFTVPAEIWKSVVPRDFQSRVVCLACFDALAAEAGIDYTPYLEAIYFSGERYGLALRVDESRDR